MGVEIIMSKEELCRIYSINRRAGFSDKDMKRSFERACTPSSVSELIEELQSSILELSDLRAYKLLSIELANRKGFDSVAAALDSIGRDRVEVEVLYDMISELWPKTNKPLRQVFMERVEQCTQSE